MGSGQHHHLAVEVQQSEKNATWYSIVMYPVTHFFFCGATSMARVQITPSHREIHHPSPSQLPNVVVTDTFPQCDGHALADRARCNQQPGS